ncbi:hypothetical protein Tco_1045338 [Tanacetum coccineum]|uniref:CCHC-type domain-containing protein n=1 Tax=Tanacetum coccineum TaxID=301880 RepID=A0ABQ5GSG3_9ASTR
MINKTRSSIECSRVVNPQRGCAGKSIQSEDWSLKERNDLRSFALRNFDLEDMEFESINSNTTAKLPILKLGEYEIYKRLFVPVTAEEKTNKKNDVKARSLLLMALPNEHQLTFSQYPDAKTMFATIETRFGGNEATKKTQKTLLKQQYENFSASSTESLDSIFNRLQKIVSRLAILGVVISQEDLNSKILSSLPPEWNTHVVVWMNKPEIETMSIDDLYNNFKIVEQKVKKFVGASCGAQNLAFMTALSTSSTNHVNTAMHAYEVSTASPDVNTTSPQVSTASFSDNVVYAFMVENPNGSNLLQQDLEQSHEDELEAMDLKWQLSLLKCFSCHKMRHFARECRAPRSKEGHFRNQDNTRKQVNNEDTSSKAMLAIDGVGFDWSDMAEEQVQTNMALMAFSDLEASKDLDKLLESQITNKSKKGLGYSVVPPPHPLIYNRPKKLDLSYSGLDEFKEPEFKGYGTENKTVFPVDKKVESVKPKNHENPVKNQLGSVHNTIKGKWMVVVPGAKIPFGDGMLIVETTSKQSNDPPLSRGYILESGEDINAARPNLVLPVQVNAAEGDSINTSIQGGTDCLPTATIFEELARMGYEKPSQKLTFYKAFFSLQWKFLIHTITQCLSAKSTAWNEFLVLGDMSHHKKIYVNPSHTKKIFANMRREGKDFSGRVTPLFEIMMVQPTQDKGVDSGIPTNSNQAPITTQPSSSRSQKKQSRRKQRKDTAVTQEETQQDDSVPTPSNDPPLSGEDSMQLSELMILCTNLQTQVLDLKKAKDDQAKEIADLKKRVQKLEKKKKSRTTGFKRLRKVGESRRVESSEHKDSLGDHEDASKQGRSIEDIDKDADVSLVDDTQERSDNEEMFVTNELHSDEVNVDMPVGEKQEQSAKEREVDTSVEDTAKPKVVTTATTTTITTRPKARGVVVQEPSEFRTPQESQPSMIKDKGKAIMIEPEVLLKRKDQVALDEDLARNLQAQLEAELLEE